jgi:pyruvate dehydrogenase E2 component (dihydrolipoamide acetyltransferase)
VTQTAPPPAPAAAPTNGGGRVKASPLAKRLAAEAGLELRSVQGSGPGGRITKRDIEAAATQPSPAAGRAPARAASGADYEDIPLTQMRKTIAKRLVTSIGPVPTFYLTIEVDMSHLQGARERINARLEGEGVKVSINDFIIKAVAVALRQHPAINAQWTDAAIRRFNRVHIGVAVAVEDGLITPIVRDADQIGVAEISQQVRELAKRARERKLQPDEYTGATFSISNLGMFGIDEFTAIINPPEAAILAIGRVEDKPVAQFGEIISQPRMRITMSCDHRVIDGATGAKFLQTLRQYLEEPTMMLV